MARCPFAAWRPITGSTISFLGGPKKVVHHKTQGGSLAGAEGAYKKNRSDPHFSVHEDGVAQHIDTRYAARALRNADGGVQTGRDGAIQIEVVGWSGKTAGAKTLANLVRLLKWIAAEEKVPWVWPMGRPPKTAEDGYGLNNGDRRPSTWDREAGHYGHSQVPENTHWDPAYTDAEWRFLNDRMGAPVAPDPRPRITEISEVPWDMDKFITKEVVTGCDPEGRGWLRFDVPLGDLVSVLGRGSHPLRDKGYWPIKDIGVQPDGAGVVVTWEEGPPSGEVVFWLKYLKAA